MISNSALAFHFRNGGSPPTPDPSNWDFRYNTFVGPLSIDPSSNPVGSGGLRVIGNVFLSGDPCGLSNTTYDYNAFVTGSGCGTHRTTNSLAAYLRGFASTRDPGDYGLLRAASCATRATRTAIRARTSPAMADTPERPRHRRLRRLSGSGAAGLTRRCSALAAGQNERRLDDGRAVAQIRRRLENRQDLPAITSRQESEALWKGETWFRRTSLVHFGAVPEEADEVAARLGVGRPREHAGGDKGWRRLGLWLRRGGSRRRVSVTLDRRRRGCCLRGRRRRRRLPGSGSARDRGSVRPGRLRVHRTRGTVAGRRLCLRDRGQCFLRRLHGNLRGVVPATLADHHPGRAAASTRAAPATHQRAPLRRVLRAGKLEQPLGFELPAAAARAGRSHRRERGDVTGTTATAHGPSARPRAGIRGPARG